MKNNALAYAVKIFAKIDDGFSKEIDTLYFWNKDSAEKVADYTHTDFDVLYTGQVEQIEYGDIPRRCRVIKGVVGGTLETSRLLCELSPAFNERWQDKDRELTFFSCLDIGDTFLFNGMKCVKLAEFDISVSKNTAIVIAAGRKSEIRPGYYIEVPSYEKVKVVKRKAYFD